MAEANWCNKFQHGRNSTNDLSHQGHTYVPVSDKSVTFANRFM